MRVHLKFDVSAGHFSELILKIVNGTYPESAGKIIMVVNNLENLIVQIYPDIKEKSMDWLCERVLIIKYYLIRLKGLKRCTNLWIR